MVSFGKNTVFLVMSSKKYRKNKKEIDKRTRVLWIATGIFTLVVAYLCFGLYFTGHFYVNAKVNGVDASGATAEVVKARAEEYAQNYFLKIETKDGSFESISKEDAGLVVDVPITTLRNYIETQNPFIWPYKLFAGDTYNAGQIVTVDDAKLREKINQLNCVKKIPVTVTSDAHIEHKGDKYVVVDEVYGDDIDKEALFEAIKTAMTGMQTELSLNDANCYVQPTVFAGDKDLINTCNAINNIMGGSVTYTLGSAKEEITVEQKKKWIIQKDSSVELDEVAIEKYIDELASKYDTYNKSKSFACGWDGHIVSCTPGTYGWKIDKEGEKNQLLEDLASGKEVTRNPIYESKAASRNGNDFGSTFIEVDMTHQMVYGHVNGEVVLKSPFVGGSVRNSTQTVLGAYAIYSKQTDRWLDGPTWHDWVSFWMPFYHGYGIHDATWRDEFGGDIYIENGSHGCVNMPLENAEAVFNTFNVGTPVLVYYQ